MADEVVGFESGGLEVFISELLDVESYTFSSAIRLDLGRTCDGRAVRKELIKRPPKLST